MIAIDARCLNTRQKTGKDYLAIKFIEEICKLESQKEIILLVYNANGIKACLGKLDNKWLSQENIKVLEIKNGLLWHYKVHKYLLSEGIKNFISFNSFITVNILPKSINSIIYVHDLIAFLYPKTHDKKAVILEWLSLPRALKKVQYIAVNSKHTESDLLKLFPKLDKTKVIIAPPASRFSDLDISEDLKENSVPSPEDYILSVATLEPRKNIQTLIKAFEILKNINKEQENLKLILIGKKGWQNTKLLKKIENNPYIIYTGHIADSSLISYYKQAKCFVYPSIYEGFGLPPLEAISLGTPVVTTNHPAINEAVGEASLILNNPLDPEELAKKINIILTDDNIRNLLQEKAKQQSKKFSWENSAKLISKKFIN